MQTFSVSGSSFFQRNRWRISSIFQVGKQSHSSINNHASSDQSQVEQDDDQKYNSKPEYDIEMFRDLQSDVWPRGQSHFNGHQWVQEAVHAWTDSIWKIMTSFLCIAICNLILTNWASNYEQLSDCTVTLFENHPKCRIWI